MRAPRSTARLILFSGIGLFAWTACSALAHEEQVIEVGRNATGQIVVDSDFPQPVGLPPSIFPGFPGFATGELGIHSILLDDPTNDFFQLSVNADFRFILLAKDPGMEIWNDFTAAYMNVGEMFHIGSAPFDNHPIWNLVNGSFGSSYSLTLKMRDLNGIYADSDPFVLSFTPAAAPGPYQIHLAATDSQHVALQWPANAIGWQLETSVSPAAAGWTTVTNVPTVAGTNFFLIVPTDSPQRFFRLRQQ